MAGNRAVAASLGAIAGAADLDGALHIVNAVSSTAAPPRGGVLQIANTATGMHAAGVTSLPAPGAPDVVIGAPVKQTDDKWQATINPTSVTPDLATSLYPGPGVHDEAPPLPPAGPRTATLRSPLPTKSKPAKRST